MPVPPNPGDLARSLGNQPGRGRRAHTAKAERGPEPRTTDLIAQSDLVRTFRPGDRFRMTFVDRPVDQDLAVGAMAFGVLATNGPGRPTATLAMEELTLGNLWAAAESGHWFVRTYEATVLAGFDPADFIYRLVRRGVLESIEKLGPQSSS
jgi:hypothetical protein